MGKLSQLELFRAAAAHEKHDEFLYQASFTDHLKEALIKKLNVTDLNEYFGFYRAVSVCGGFGHRAPYSKQPDVAEKYYGGMNIPDGSTIDNIGVLRAPGGYFHFTHLISPLRNAETLDEIEKFPYYLPIPEFDLEDLKQKTEAVHAQGKVAQCAVHHLYERAWQIRGYEPFLMDMIGAPENCEYILDRINEHNLRLAEYGAMAGVDVLITGDDVANQRAMMFAPELWRKFIKERWAKVYAAARKIKPDIQIWYHSDGNIEEIIPELIEIGVTILNPLQPECMDVADLKKRYGKQLVFDGAIGTQTTMSFSSPDEVRRVVRENKKNLGYDGALILSPTHILEPEVPVENVIAFAEACREKER